MPLLFVDISGHGLGHLAQVAPVLRALHARRPDCEFVIRSSIAPVHLEERIGLRIGPSCRHIAEASDFGFVMHDTFSIDFARSAERYRAAHADWPAAVAADAALLRELQPDFVLSDVSYRPLAAARQLGVPAAGMCSLNWADLFHAFFCSGPAPEAWAVQIHAQISAAYAGTPFLCLSPGMPAPAGCEVVPVAPIAAAGKADPAGLRQRCGAPMASRVVLFALGGIPTRLNIDWNSIPDGWLCIVPAAWQVEHPACRSIPSLDWDFSDLLASVDAVVSKPGYGTFAEAACNGVPVAWLPREAWPEQFPLVQWLERHARCIRLDPAPLATGIWPEILQMLWASPEKPRPAAQGAAQVVAWLLAKLPGSR